MPIEDKGQIYQLFISHLQSFFLAHSSIYRQLSSSTSHNLPTQNLYTSTSFRLSRLHDVEAIVTYMELHNTKSPSLSLQAFVFVASCFLSASTTAAYKFYVGGRDGWVVHPSQDYNQWAGRNRFLIGDILCKSLASWPLSHFC